MRPRGAIATLEEALSLLREAPGAAIATYLIGAVPFLLTLLFFFTEMLRNPFASDRLVIESLAVAVSLLWKHSWQAIFAARLHQQLSPRPIPRGTILRMIAIQSAIQPLRLILVPLSLLATVPFAAVIAFFRNLALFTALGDPDPVTAARRMASIWTRQNWAMLTVVSLAALLLFANIFILMVAIPSAIRSIWGIENDLTRLGASGFLNWTTTAVAMAVAWLAIDPLLTAVYVLRCFYGASVATGEDLTVAWKRAVTIAAMLLVLLGAGAIAHAQPPPQAAPAIDAQQLNQAIDQTLHQREFAWRLPPTESDPHPRWTSWLREVGAWIGRVWDWILKRMEDAFGSPQSQEQRPSSSLRSALKLWSGAVALVLVAAILFFVLRRRGKPLKAVQAAVSAAPAANLADESLTADTLPESSWRKLAEESLERGEYRLALRALYLAGLNYLSQRQLVSIRRWKSGLDYRREVERRVRTNPSVSPELAPAFSTNLVRFERGWYGAHAVDRADVEAFLSGLEEMRRHAERS